MSHSLAILNKVKAVGGRLWRDGSGLKGRFPQRDPQLEQQIKTYKADILSLIDAQERKKADKLDQQVKEKGWAVLKSGEAYEIVLHRSRYFGKVPGQDREILMQNEHVVYLFQEENDTWTAWRASFKNKPEPSKERDMAVCKSFDEAFKAAMWYIDWYKNKRK